MAQVMRDVLLVVAVEEIVARVATTIDTMVTEESVVVVDAVVAAALKPVPLVKWVHLETAGDL